MRKRHGLKGTKEYTCWQHRKKLCFDKNGKQYKNYGGRGITMYEEWIHNPVLFISYIKSLENYGKEGYTLDRIDNNGNYEPDNLRWSSHHIQCINQRIRKNSRTGYKGVSINISKGYICYRATLGKKELGYYKTIEEALEKRNNYIIENNLTEYKIQ